jgi:hypothetical protein
MEKEGYELVLAENAGEVDSKNFEGIITIGTTTLLKDIARQLKFTPENFTYTIGWRAYVWKNTTTGIFEALSDDEFQHLSNGEFEIGLGESGEDDSGLTSPTARVEEGTNQ